MMLTLSQYSQPYDMAYIYLVFICEFIEAKAKSKYTPIPIVTIYTEIHANRV
jgi:hypothetical protein